MLSLEQRLLSLKNQFLDLNDKVFFVKEVEIRPDLSYITLVSSDFKQIREAVFTDSHYNIIYYEQRLIKEGD